MKIKAEINLEDIWADGCAEDTVANVVRDEIKRAIATVVRDQVKAKKLELQQLATKAVETALKGK